MSTPAGKWSVFRHIFTSAPDDFPGGGGFRTVACAAALRDMVPPLTLEFLVESYNNREGGGASCRQFVPLARGAKAYALTVFTPLADSPDGRIGNFWAETQVVPIDWLEQAGWDAAAAFEALSWLGPRDLGRLPRNLEPEALAPLAPGSVERLARLGELVPPDCLDALLHAVVQQSRGLRPLRLLEAQGTPSSHLETVVMLLPLTVPPTSRRYRDDDQHRCLTLRTRCPIGGMTFAADIAGYPSAAADGLESADGFVIDLAGRLRTTSTNDRYGREYAQWLRSVIQEGKWDQLEALYKRAVAWPGASLFENYQSLLEAPSRSSVMIIAETAEPAATALEHIAENEPSGVEALEAVLAPPVGVPEEPTVTPVQDRQRDWTTRDRVEGELWQMRESHRSQIDELVAKIRQDFAADLEKARTRLLEDVGAQRKGLKADLEEVEKELKKSGKRAQQKNQSSSRESSSVETRLEKLERELAQLRNRLKQLGAPGQPSDVADIAPESSVPTDEKDVPEKRSFQDLRALSREWLLGRRWIAVVAVMGMALGLLGAFALSRMGNIPSKDVAPVDRRALEVRASLRERLGTGTAAAPILASAAQRTDIAQKAHVLTVALALRQGIQIDGELDCALLQTALRVPVDGDCGAGTINSLVYATESNCCRSFHAELDKSKLRSCFVTRYLRLGPEEAGQRVEACRGESPWQKGRIWTDEEASSALALFQMASNVYQGQAGSELDQSLRRLDPEQRPHLRQSFAGETLTREEATRVVELAWATFTGRNAQLGDLTVKELEELSRFVDQIVQQAAGPRVASDGAP